MLLEGYKAGLFAVCISVWVYWVLMRVSTLIQEVSGSEV